MAKSPHPKINYQETFPLLLFQDTGPNCSAKNDKSSTILSLLSRIWECSATNRQGAAWMLSHSGHVTLHQAVFLALIFSINLKSELISRSNETIQKCSIKLCKSFNSTPNTNATKSKHLLNTKNSAYTELVHKCYKYQLLGYTKTNQLEFLPIWKSQTGDRRQDLQQSVGTKSIYKVRKGEQFILLLKTKGLGLSKTFLMVNRI